VLAALLVTAGAKASVVFFTPSRCMATVASAERMRRPAISPPHCCSSTTWRTILRAAGQDTSQWSHLRSSTMTQDIDRFI